MEGRRKERDGAAGPARPGLSRRGRTGGRRAAGTALLATVVALLTAGCATTTSIDRLLADPMAHDGEEVRIEGEVQESVGFLQRGVYRVDDGTGRLPVLSRMGGAPRSGTRVVVEGTFRAALTVGEETLAGLVEEEREVKD